MACCSSTLAQEIDLKLFVFKDDKPVEKFGIANLNSKIEGEFLNGYHVIKAEQGDQLFIASAEFNNFYATVSQEDIEHGYIQVHFKDGVIVLDEVVLTHRKLSHGKFTDYEPKAYTPAEARLKAATKMYYKSSGLSLGLDPIINMISGRTKRLKKELKAETSSRIVVFLHNNYQKFMLEELEVPEANYHLFCYYVSDHNKGIHKINNRKRVEFIIRRLYLKFVEQTSSEL
ncbi:MAG TPA: hypothetical protein VFM79_05445 [Pelobium sp.]|nr:hypothetical protein [Pelobium sp.]